MSAQDVRYEVLLREKCRLEAGMERQAQRLAALRRIADAADAVHALLWHRAGTVPPDLTIEVHDQELAAALRERLQALREALEQRA